MTRYDGMDSAALAARLRAPSCLCLTKVSSTLDVVHELADDGAPAGTVVVADEQLAGRGRQGRTWHSPPGVGIWLGYLARPSVLPEGGGVMALRVGLTVVATLRQLGADPRLKWPNDIVVRDRKLAGILCEARWAGAQLGWVAIGIGMNIHRPLPADIAPNAIALDEIVSDMTRVAVLELLVPQLHALPNSVHLTSEECATFREHDWLAGKQLREPVAGRSQGIDSDGALVVETAGGLQRIVGGGVVTT